MTKGNIFFFAFHRIPEQLRLQSTKWQAINKVSGSAPVLGNSLLGH